MFDYAMFIHLLELRISPKSDKTLYVFPNTLAKKRFIRHHSQLENVIVLTINDIWYKDRLVGCSYKEYQMMN